MKIGAITWTIKQVEEAEIDCDGRTIGDQSESTQLIRIARNLSPEMKEEVLIHEILHCINPQLDHGTVEMVAKALHQVLKENNLLNLEELHKCLEENY